MLWVKEVRHDNCGKNIQLRTAEIEDVEFFLELRTHSEKTKYLSQVEKDLAKYQAWFRDCKKKEQSCEEYYFVIESKTSEKFRLVGVYDLKPDWFCWGSWLSKDQAPTTTAIESALLIYEFGFGQLGY